MAADSMIHPPNAGTAATLLLLTLALRPVPADAGCCQVPDSQYGCFEADNEAQCAEFLGSYHADGTCDYELRECTGGGAVTTTTSTTTPASTTTTLPAGSDDGRLDPHADDYYVVYCAFDRIEIWRGTPVGQLLSTVPILDVLYLDAPCTGDGGGLRVGDIRVCRLADVVTVSGTNGNRAPAPGSKSFALSECIARNGGEPPRSADPSASPTEDGYVGEACSYSPFFLSHDADCLAELGMDLTDNCLAQVFLYFFYGDTDRVRSARSPRDAGPSGIDVVQLYRLRDRVLETTPGGRRAVALYYQYGRDMIAAGVRDFSVLAAGHRALVEWMPVIDALVAGRGDTVTVSPDQARLANEFLAAATAAAVEPLRTALEREPLLVGADGVSGLSGTQVLERLQRLGCEAARTVPSVRCRLGDLSRLVRDRIEARAGKRLAARVRKAEAQAARAEAAVSGGKTRRVTASLRRLGRLLGAVEGALGAKPVQQSPEAVRAVLGGMVAAVRADTDALLQDPPVTRARLRAPTPSTPRGLRGSDGRATQP